MLYLGLGRLRSNTYVFYTLSYYSPIILSMHLSFSIVLTEFHTRIIQNDNNSQTVTVRIFGGHIVALLKVVCSSPKQMLALKY